MKNIKKIFAIFAVFVLALCVVGCKETKAPSTEGIVYSVLFDTGVSGMEVESQAVEAGKLAVEPKLELRAGYVLAGWKCGEEWWDFETSRVSSNIELVAVWVQDDENWSYTDGLSFSYDSGAEGYVVSDYNGTEKNVVVPLYYDGDNGIKPVYKIGDFAFKNNSVIETINTGAGVSIIGKSAFDGSSLLTIIINKNIELIGQSAFENASSLQSISFERGDKNLVIDKFAFSGTTLKSIVFPDRLVEIGNSSFAGLALEAVRFGSDSRLNRIGNYAFRATDLLHFETPKTVKIIGTGAFDNCLKLETIIISSALEEVGTNVISSCDKLTGVFYTNTKPQILNGNTTWKGVSVLEYNYSLTPIKNTWDYGSDGTPALHKNIKAISVDFTEISEIFGAGESYLDYKFVVVYYTQYKEGVYSQNKFNCSIDEQGEGVFEFDAFAANGFVVELHLLGEYETPSEFSVVAKSEVVSIEYSELEVVSIDKTIEKMEISNK